MRSSSQVFRHFVLEELEKHLILNSNRLRTFEDARLKIATYVEAKFGLRTRDSKPSETEGNLIPWMLMRSILCHPAQEKGHRLHEMVVSSAVEHNFNGIAMHAKATASHRLAKANRASHGPRVRTKERVKRGRVNPNQNPKVPKVRTGVKTSKTGLSGLENPKSETSSESQESAQTYPTDNSYTENSWCDDGWSYDEWNDDWRSVGGHKGWDQTCDNSAISFSVGSLDLVP